MLRRTPKIICLVMLMLASIIIKADASVLLKRGAKLADVITPEILATAKNGEVFIGDMIFGVEPSILASFPGNLWSNGIILYRFDAALSEDKRAYFVAACNAWTIGTPLTCKERTSERDYILVREHVGDKCTGPNISCSMVGRQGDAQNLWIYQTHWSQPYVLQHEIGHAIGLIHEHQRPDRDAFIFVVEGNVKNGQMPQFDVWSDVTMSTQYDYVSIMHYFNCSFAKDEFNCSLQRPDLQTIVPKACALDEVGGATITKLDYDGIRMAYAPKLQAVLIKEQLSACGVINYEPSAFQAICAPYCDVIGGTQYKKVEEPYENWCGYMSTLPADYEKNKCVRMKKTYMTSWWDHDDFSCGRLHAETLHELWVRCGCPMVTVAAACTNVNKFSVDSYEERDKIPDWKSGRVVYFNDVMKELEQDNLLADDVKKNLGNFYQLNYLDRRFETKLMRVRAGIYSLARWQRSLNPAYQLTGEMVEKIMKYRKLRWH